VSRARPAFLFAAVLALSLTTFDAASSAAAAPPRPRMLVAEGDSWSGLAALKAKYAAGARPSDDLPGWALSYLLSGEESFARKALAELPSAEPRRLKGSNLYMLFLARALAFDWLYGYPGFDAALKEKVARELVEGASKMLARPSLADPRQASYHNHTVRELALATVALAAVEGEPSVEAQAAPLRAQARAALDNILETTELVDPEGSYHESMDYMRITWAPLALLAELRRTTTGEDPARRYGVFRNMGPTYLYKVLPDGSTARDDDNEYPHLDAVDNVVLGYAVHRFKDPFAAWVLQQRAWLPKEWGIPVLEFLWSDPTVAPRDPSSTTEAELPRSRLFPGVGHLVMRNGFGPDATWIEFACGPYFAKHDHLDTNHFVVYRKGYLAIEAGADYTDTESPHYLNHYRRTVAHNTMLVYRPGERFFWGENLWPAANDGGQRMDSSRFWNSVRSLEDFRRTRDLWDRGKIEAYETIPGTYVYTRGDGTRAYHPEKVERFVRSLVYLPEGDVLFVLDRVVSRDPSFKKVWLLHAVGEPKVEGGSEGRAIGHGGTSHRDATAFTLEDGGGRLRVMALLPKERDVVVRGGPGFEFWTPGDERGGAWGSGQNWPLDPPEGGPLPADPYLKKMWLTFWGEDLKRLSPSNRKAVVPGSWRVEVSPQAAAREDVFLHALVIGERGAPAKRVEGVNGYGLAGAVVEGDGAVLFATEGTQEEAEATIPDIASRFLVIAGLDRDTAYSFQLTSSFAPGSPVWRQVESANGSGVVYLPWTQKAGRLRVVRQRKERP
jgi:Heparinase II/III-like protein